MDPKANFWMFGLTRWMKFLLWSMDELNSRNQLDAKKFSWCSGYHSQDRLQAKSPWTAPWYVGDWNSCFRSSGRFGFAIWNSFDDILVRFSFELKTWVKRRFKFQDGDEGGHFLFRIQTERVRCWNLLSREALYLEASRELSVKPKPYI